MIRTVTVTHLLHSFLNYAANTLASPLVHVPAIIVVSLIAKRNTTTHQAKYNISIAFASIWLLLCSLPYPSAMLIRPLEYHFPKVEYDDDNWQKADAIVVLACSFYDEDELPFVSRWHSCSMKRNLQATLMYRHKKKPIYLSGGLIKGEGKAHAVFNKDFITTLGVAHEDIFLSEKGDNTATEVASLTPLLKGKTIALVTSASHQIRASKYFKLKGINVIPIPVEHLSLNESRFIIGYPTSSNLYRSERAIHEYLGLIAQSLFHRQGADLNDKGVE